MSTGDLLNNLRLDHQFSDGQNFEATSSPHKL